MAKHNFPSLGLKMFYIPGCCIVRGRDVEACTAVFKLSSPLYFICLKKLWFKLNKDKSVYLKLCGALGVYNTQTYCGYICKK